MNMQLNVKSKTIDVYYYNSKGYMISSHLNIENISQEDKNTIETMLKYFKDLKEEDVHIQEPTR